MDTNLSLLQRSLSQMVKLDRTVLKKKISFNLLCDDYLLVVDQIRRHSASEAQISSADVAELKKLLSELEQEMIIYFEGDQREIILRVLTEGHGLVEE